MDKIQINRESLAKRCEICHQNDLFDAKNNNCLRCKILSKEKLIGKDKKDLIDFNSLISSLKTNFAQIFSKQPNKKKYLFWLRGTQVMKLFGTFFIGFVFLLYSIVEKSKYPKLFTVLLLPVGILSLLIYFTFKLLSGEFLASFIVRAGTIISISNKGVRLKIKSLSKKIDISWEDIKEIRKLQGRFLNGYEIFISDLYTYQFVLNDGNILEGDVLNDESVEKNIIAKRIPLVGFDKIIKLSIK